MQNEGDTNCVIARRNDEAICYLNISFMKRGGSVYIMTNVHNQVLYTGVTSDIVRRVSEHKEKKYDKSFSAAYNLDKLVYYENYQTIEEAIAEEKRIKGGSRIKEDKVDRK